MASQYHPSCARVTRLIARTVLSIFNCVLSCKWVISKRIQNFVTLAASDLPWHDVMEVGGESPIPLWKKSELEVAAHYGGRTTPPNRFSPRWEYIFRPVRKLRLHAESNPYLPGTLGQPVSRFFLQSILSNGSTNHMTHSVINFLRLMIWFTGHAPVKPAFFP